MTEVIHRERETNGRHRRDNEAESPECAERHEEGQQSPEQRGTGLCDNVVQVQRSALVAEQKLVGFLIKL